MNESNFTMNQGNAQPLGVSCVDGFINIAVLAPAARTVYFCVFDGAQEMRFALPAQTDGVHHGQIRMDIPADGLHYGLRAAGVYAPEQGLFFDEAKLLVDPYATELSHGFAYDDALSCQNFGVDTAAYVPKAIVQSDVLSALNVQAKPARVIYEASVKALTTLHPEVPEAIRGTVAALREPCVMAHLQKIGIDTLELMPITAWVNERHLHHLGLSNAWGYNPIAMMAVDPVLCPGGIIELRETIAALRAAGIQTILDVVFNHTGESDVGGPTLSMRGLDNQYYYQHDANHQLINVAGCGNTLDCACAGVVRLVIDSLRYWVQRAGVAGFRFDLAPVLGRLPTGFDADAPLLQMMREDDVLRHVLLIAEPWDIGAGGYQLGQFGTPWLEWNDRYRDDVRRFWQGTGTASSLATRLAGSSDFFGTRSSAASVNFIAAHDGFCLHDLVSYQQKNNFANGEGNRDGSNDNFSWNHGAQGETSDARILHKRQRDVRALLATLFVSQGTLMFTAGDELGKTQMGNNNAYAQDNRTTWIDWVNQDDALIDFVAQCAQMRRDCAALTQDAFLNPQTVTWHRADGRVMNEHDWHNNSQVLGMHLLHDAGDVWVWLNSSDVDVPLQLPPDVILDCVLNSALGTFEQTAPAVLARSVLVLQPMGSFI